MVKFEYLERFVSYGLPDQWWVSVDKKVNENTKTLSEIKEFAFKGNYKKLQVLNSEKSKANQWLKLSKPIDTTKPPPPPQNILAGPIKPFIKMVFWFLISCLISFLFNLVIAGRSYFDTILFEGFWISVTFLGIYLFTKWCVKMREALMLAHLRQGIGVTKKEIRNSLPPVQKAPIRMPAETEVKEVVPPAIQQFRNMPESEREDELTKLEDYAREAQELVGQLETKDAPVVDRVDVPKSIGNDFGKRPRSITIICIIYWIIGGLRIGQGGRLIVLYDQGLIENGADLYGWWVVISGFLLMLLIFPLFSMKRYGAKLVHWLAGVYILISVIWTIYNSFLNIGLLTLGLIIMALPYAIGGYFVFNKKNWQQMR